MCGWKQWVELSKVVKLINIMGIQLTNIHSENKYKHSTLPHEESLLAIFATKSVTMIREEWGDSSCSNRHHQQSNRRRHCQKTTGAGQPTACRTLAIHAFSVYVLQEKSSSLQCDLTLNWWNSPVRRSDTLRTEDRPAARQGSINGNSNKRLKVNENVVCLYSVCGAPCSICARWPVGREAQ